MSNIDTGRAIRLLPSAVVCYRLDGIRRETLSRGKGTTYPAPDRVINGRNYWFDTTIDAFVAGDEIATVKQSQLSAEDSDAAEAKDSEAAEAEADKDAEGDDEEADADAPAAA